MAHRWRSGLFFLLLVASTAFGSENNFRIQHSEAISSATRITPDASNPLQGAALLSFQAYGRQFDLELQPNRHLLSALPVEQRRATERYSLYRGKLRGLSGTWVRLTQVGTELYGAVWDGHDLYAIEPARIVSRLSFTPTEAKGSTPVVYRLSDVYLTPGTQFCGLEANEDRKTALSAYQEMVDGFTAMATAGTLSGQIEIAVLGDAQFAALQSDPQGAALARMNIVDGIFSEQVGITVVVPEVRIFDNGNNPFSTNIPSDLLNQLADYRSANPTIRNKGLAHLFTGRNLDGNTVGIAYLNALCHSRNGASLSESRALGLTSSALVAAHEIGHNFGAPHDGDVNSGCASTPQTFLMAPQLNGSSTFSSCSLQQMAPRIQFATCITPAQYSDGAVIAPNSFSAIQDNAFDYTFSVDTTGSESLQNAVATIQFFGAIAIDSASVPGGTCTSGAGTVTCQLGTLPAQTSRVVLLRVRSLQSGNSNSETILSADNDQFSTNNRATPQINIVQVDPSDAALTGTTTSVSGTVDQTFSYAFEVWVPGAQPIYDLKVSLPLPPGFSLVSVAADSVPCTSSSGVVVCNIGQLDSGAHRQINLNLRATTVGSFSTTATLSALNDTSPQNDSRTLPVTIDAAPTPAPVQSDGGGGGGGGSASWLTLLMLSILTRRQWARRLRVGHAT